MSARLGSKLPNMWEWAETSAPVVSCPIQSTWDWEGNTPVAFGMEADFTAPVDIEYLVDWVADPEEFPGFEPTGTVNNPPDGAIAILLIETEGGIVLYLDVSDLEPPGSYEPSGTLTVGNLIFNSTSYFNDEGFIELVFGGVYRQDINPNEEDTLTICVSIFTYPSD